MRVKFKIDDEVILNDTAKADTVRRWRRQNGYQKAGVFKILKFWGNGNMDVVSADGVTETWDQHAFSHVKAQPYAPSKVRATFATDLRLKPQARTILSHLRKQTITPMEALVTYGMTRLAASVHELRNAGHDIKTDVRDDERGHKYARYSLVKRELVH